MAGDPDHPTVLVRLHMRGEGTGMQVYYGYLSIIDGVPWLATTLDDARSKVTGLMQRLDPQKLDMSHDGPEGAPQWTYQMEVSLD